MAADPRPPFSFSDPQVLAQNRVVNDSVMGGVSTSELVSEPGVGVFRGAVSLEHNGGFVSFRGPLTLPAGTQRLYLQLRGDGKRYKLTLKLDDNNQTWQYQSPFETTGQWQELSFGAGDFQASFRGRPVQAPALDFAAVRTLGVLLSDRQSGAFRLELRQLRAEGE